MNKQPTDNHPTDELIEALDSWYESKPSVFIEEPAEAAQILADWCALISPSQMYKLIKQQKEEMGRLLRKKDDEQRVRAILWRDMHGIGNIPDNDKEYVFAQAAEDLKDYANVLGENIQQKEEIERLNRILQKLVDKDLNPPLLVRDDGTTIELSVNKLLEENTQLKEEIKRGREVLEKILTHIHDSWDKDRAPSANYIANLASTTEGENPRIVKSKQETNKESE